MWLLVLQVLLRIYARLIIHQGLGHSQSLEVAGIWCGISMVLRGHLGRPGLLVRLGRVGLRAPLGRQARLGHQGRQVRAALAVLLVRQGRLAQVGLAEQVARLVVRGLVELQGLAGLVEQPEPLDRQGRLERVGRQARPGRLELPALRGLPGLRARVVQRVRVARQAHQVRVGQAAQRGLVGRLARLDLAVAAGHQDRPEQADHLGRVVRVVIDMLLRRVVKSQ
jgi:hypothetical protein